jgi:hypothetical protein
MTQSQFAVIIEARIQSTKEEAKMNKSRLIGGIICLAVAGLLAALNVVLPADKMIFMVGDTNMPYVPPVVLGIVGLGLIITSWRR